MEGKNIKPVCQHNPAIDCPCPKDCPRHGKCCQCVAHHREHGNLPICLRGLVNKAKTYSEIVSARYSCKKYTSEQISKEQLDAILEAGRLAPTAKNLQEQHVYVLQSESALAKIDANTPCRYGAPTCLVVAFNKNNVFTYPGGKRTSGVEDATIVATHMILAAKSVGVDSCWINFVDPDKLAKDLGLPEDEEILMIMDLGYAAEGAGPLDNHFSRKPLEETVSYL